MGRGGMARTMPLLPQGLFVCGWTARRVDDLRVPLAERGPTSGVPLSTGPWWFSCDTPYGPAPTDAGRPCLPWVPPAMCGDGPQVSPALPPESHLAGRAPP